MPKTKEPTSATDSGLENGTSSLRTAPIYCITGLLVEILRELALPDSSLIQCLRPPLLSAAAATAATITAATVATATTTVPGAVKSKNDENSVINLSEERTGIEYSSSHLPVPITASKISNSKHNEGSPQIDTDADSEASLSIECMMVESSQLLLESLMTLMDTPVNSSKEIEKDGISLVTLPSTVPGAGVVTKIVRKTSTSEVSLNPSQLATCYTLKSSSINSSCHVDQNISDSKSMELFFRPLDADNSVRHLLSLIGFIYSQSLADTIITEKYSDGQLIVENMIKERKESEEVRTEVDDTVEAVKEELKRSEEKEEKRILEGLLRALLCLPKRYYTEERFKMQLLPTLQSVYEGREDELKEKLFRITSQ